MWNGAFAMSWIFLFFAGPFEIGWAIGIVGLSSSESRQTHSGPPPATLIFFERNRCQRAEKPGGVLPTRDLRAA